MTTYATEVARRLKDALTSEKKKAAAEFAEREAAIAAQAAKAEQDQRDVAAAEASAALTRANAELAQRIAPMVENGIVDEVPTREQLDTALAWFNADNGAIGRAASTDCEPFLSMKPDLYSQPVLRDGMRVGPPERLVSACSAVWTLYRRAVGIITAEQEDAQERERVRARLAYLDAAMAEHVENEATISKLEN